MDIIAVQPPIPQVALVTVVPEPSSLWLLAAHDRMRGSTCLNINALPGNARGATAALQKPNQRAVEVGWESISDAK